MRRSFITAVAMLLASILAAGCFDSATPSGSAGTTGGGATASSSGGTQAVPHWQIRYEVGFPEPVRHRLPACPAGMRCHDVIAKGWSTSSGKPLWARVSTRTLVCPSGTGDYPHGRSACRGLATLRAVLARKPTGFCSCPPPPAVPGEATLVGGRRRILVSLWFCDYCGHGDSRAVDHALALLQPPR